MAAQCGNVGMDAARTGGMRPAATEEEAARMEQAGGATALQAHSGLQQPHSGLCLLSGDVWTRL